MENLFFHYLHIHLNVKEERKHKKAHGIDLNKKIKADSQVYATFEVMKVFGWVDELTVLDGVMVGGNKGVWEDKLAVAGVWVEDLVVAEELK